MVKVKVKVKKTFRFLFHSSIQVKVGCNDLDVILSRVSVNEVELS